MRVNFSVSKISLYSFKDFIVYNNEQHGFRPQWRHTGPVLVGNFTSIIMPGAGFHQRAAQTMVHSWVQSAKTSISCSDYCFKLVLIFLYYFSVHMIQKYMEMNSYLDII